MSTKNMRYNLSVVKGIKILEYLSKEFNGAKLSDISRAMKMPASNLTLFVNSLVECGYVIKTITDGKYYLSDRLGCLITHANNSLYSQLELVAEGEMKRLYHKFDENVLLAVMNGYQLQFLRTLQSKRTVQILNNEGKYFLPHISAAGKALLAQLNPKMLDLYFENTELKRFTAQTLTDRASIEAELKLVRENGYAINRGEFENEILAAAAPIFRGDTVLAAIIVQFPNFRYRVEQLPEFAQEIVTSAKKIESKLNETAPLIVPNEANTD
jgi:DNA-binding IclR family transcriptional regulator